MIDVQKIYAVAVPNSLGYDGALRPPRVFGHGPDKPFKADAFGGIPLLG